MNFVTQKIHFVAALEKFYRITSLVILLPLFPSDCFSQITNSENTLLVYQYDAIYKSCEQIIDTTEIVSTAFINFEETKDILIVTGYFRTKSRYYNTWVTVLPPGEAHFDEVLLYQGFDIHAMCYSPFFQPVAY